MCLETYPITARSFEKDYSSSMVMPLRGLTNTISGFQKWSETNHAEDWLVFKECAEGATGKERNPIRVNATYHPEKLENEEKRAEILARSKYLLMMSPDKWTDTQKECAAILFMEYSKIENAYPSSG